MLYRTPEINIEFNKVLADVRYLKMSRIRDVSYKMQKLTLKLEKHASSEQ